MSGIVFCAVVGFRGRFIFYMYLLTRFRRAFDESFARPASSFPLVVLKFLRALSHHPLESVNVGCVWVLPPPCLGGEMVSRFCRSTLCSPPLCNFRVG